MSAFVDAGIVRTSHPIRSGEESMHHMPKWVTSSSGVRPVSPCLPKIDLTAPLSCPTSSMSMSL